MAKNGGARRGAGRRPVMGERKRQQTVGLTPTVWRFLETRPGSRQQAIEELIRESVQFRAWEVGANLPKGE